MKILLTGSGTGGHFYPLIAVAEELRHIADEERFIQPQLYFAGPTPYDKDALLENDIEFVKIPAGKIRRYASILNITDMWKTGIGVLRGLFVVFSIFPDVIFSKGGYTSVPVVFAAWFFGIPIVIHESDSKPGRANLWAAKFAKRIAISYPTAAQYFPEKKTALTGNPIRKAIREPQSSGAYEYLKLEEGTPVIFVLGGSLGAKRINEIILDTLSDLVQTYQIIHQTGQAHIDNVVRTAHVILENNPSAHRYHPFAHLGPLAMKMSAGAADLVVSRAGSTIFEIAQWGLPSIILPLSEDISHDQLHNAITYAKSGACLVIEDHNLTPNVLLVDIKRILDNEHERVAMIEAAQSFTKHDAATIIARELFAIGLKHEGVAEESTADTQQKETSTQSTNEEGKSEMTLNKTSKDDIVHHVANVPQNKTVADNVHTFSIGPH